MAGKFRVDADVQSDPYDWGTGRWISHPASTSAKQLTVLDGIIAPGKGHSFHKHLDQEEVLYVLSGRVEQWVDRERRILGPGEAAFIPAGVVHASFTAGPEESRVLVIFSPAKGEFGFESVEVAGEAPWSELRGRS